jgi:hypothetical protein
VQIVFAVTAAGNYIAQAILFSYIGVAGNNQIRFKYGTDSFKNEAVPNKYRSCIELVIAFV